MKLESAINASPGREVRDPRLEKELRQFSRANRATLLPLSWFSRFPTADERLLAVAEQAVRKHSRALVHSEEFGAVQVAQNLTACSARFLESRRVCQAVAVPYFKKSAAQRHLSHIAHLLSFAAIDASERLSQGKFKGYFMQMPRACELRAALPHAFFVPSSLALRDDEQRGRIIPADRISYAEPSFLKGGPAVSFGRVICGVFDGTFSELQDAVNLAIAHADGVAPRDGVLLRSEWAKAYRRLQRQMRAHYEGQVDALVDRLLLNLSPQARPQHEQAQRLELVHQDNIRRVRAIRRVADAEWRRLFRAAHEKFIEKFRQHYAETPRGTEVGVGSARARYRIECTISALERHAARVGARLGIPENIRALYERRRELGAARVEKFDFKMFPRLHIEERLEETLHIPLRCDVRNEANRTIHAFAPWLALHHEAHRYFKWQQTGIAEVFSACRGLSHELIDSLNSQCRTKDGWAFILHEGVEVHVEALTALIIARAAGPRWMSGVGKSYAALASYFAGHVLAAEERYLAAAYARVELLVTAVRVASFCDFLVADSTDEAVARELRQAAVRVGGVIERLNTYSPHANGKCSQIIGREDLLRMSQLFEATAGGVRVRAFGGRSGHLGGAISEIGTGVDLAAPFSR